MKLRICDGYGERIEPPAIESVERALAAGVLHRPGAEISLSDGIQWLAAVAVAAEEFLFSSGKGEAGTLGGPVGRDEMLRRFREFLLASAYT